MVTAKSGGIVSASRLTGRGVVSDRFNQGCQTFHQEEIEAGKRLASAAIIVHGEQESRRLLKSDPALVFKPFRYGRRVDFDGGDGNRWLVVLIGDDCSGGKAQNAHIMVPGRSGWAAFRDRVRRLAIMPRWADGFTATAEALDEMGYAIAESIAAMLLLEMESDEHIAIEGGQFTRQASKRRPRFHYLRVEHGRRGPSK